MRGVNSARAWQVLSAQYMTISLLMGCVCENPLRGSTGVEHCLGTHVIPRGCINSRRLPGFHCGFSEQGGPC